MTYFHYYATTSRNLDRVLQYGVFPIAQAIGWSWCKKWSPDPLRDSARLARWISAGTYAALTTAFLGAESEIIDQNSREAVSAELGIEPEKLVFSDYKYSSNAIIRKAHRDMMALQKYRYGTDALFLLPTVIDRSYEKLTGGKELPSTKRMLGSNKEDAKKYSVAEILLNGHTAPNFGVLAAKALYWAGETYFIDKSGHYEVVKLLENLHSVGKDMEPNDLLAVYQRTRNVDMGLPLMERPEEYEALRPLLARMADAYNKHDKKFGIPEIVYLMGLGKVNIHASDHQTLSQEAVKKSEQDIDKVISLGLAGIRAEKKKLREMQGISDNEAVHPKGFLDRLGDGTIGAAQGFRNMFRSKKHKRLEEYVTVRDPGELTNYSINR